ncbi:hypothetical protein DACRYDRAFT_22899 [Dacryopinax primogenitus]|uniref:Uncharacterized protein n=1 Tax=Dacryopinax primogenitus (strain DJM 731) TaxID=1858805 RepID=M5GAZ6_DACPD|nr:uncharacterized protein DACRYDRAFT_22899 [Dacryopinax primogenitus]EJU01118.1 hypothetical protein DACRYDRAFT_22899 [Dacryopinax primogenitus]
MAEMRKEMERMCAEVARIDARSQEQSLPLPHSAPALEPSPPRPPPLSSLPSLADEREDISSQITSALPEAKFYTDSARIDLSEEMDASLSTHFTHFNKVDEELQSLGKHLRAMGEEMGGMREEAGRKWEEMLAKVRGVLEVSRACVGLLTRLDPEVQSGTAAAENVERPAGQVQDDHEGQGMILDQA